VSFFCTFLNIFIENKKRRPNVMAKLGRFQLKNINQYPAMEGYSLFASIYLDGKRIGKYTDYGNGGLGETDYISKDAEIAMTEYIVERAEKHPNDFILQMYENDNSIYLSDKERFAKFHPYIPEERLSKEVLSAADIDYLVSDFMKLYGLEKAYKKMAKKGYGALSADGFNITHYPVSWSEDQIKKAAGKDKIYWTLDDFITD
jgi:hypothetical protein